MRQTFIALFLVAGACSPGETADSTTSSTSTSMVTTTTEQLITTTTPATTTTTAASTTTSTRSPSSSTTTGMLEGNWADKPLVTTDFGALGWWDGSGWLDAESEGALPVVGGEDYQVTRLGELARTTAGSQTIVCETLELIGVRLEDPELLGDWPGPYGVAISAPWELQPHMFEEMSDDGTYAGLATELLSSRGLDVANPVIKQLFRTDLEGDGVNEVLAVTEEVAPGLLLEEGDYSIAFLRKEVDGQVQTSILGDTVVLGEDDRFAGAHSFGGVADLNGDDKMEIISNTAFFEGFDVRIWEYLGDDLGPAQVLVTGCGA